MLYKITIDAKVMKLSKIVFLLVCVDHFNSMSLKGANFRTTYRFNGSANSDTPWLQLKRERELGVGRRSNAEKSLEGSGSPLAAQYSWNRGSPRRKIAGIDTLRGSIPSERRERFLIEPF